MGRPPPTVPVYAPWISRGKVNIIKCAHCGKRRRNPDQCTGCGSTQTVMVQVDRSPNQKDQRQ
jgi:hypothetical protein